MHSFTQFGVQACECAVQLCDKYNPTYRPKALVLYRGQVSTCNCCCRYAVRELVSPGLSELGSQPTRVRLCALIHLVWTNACDTTAYAHVVMT